MAWMTWRGTLDVTLAVELASMSCPRWRALLRRRCCLEWSQCLRRCRHLATPVGEAEWEFTRSTLTHSPPQIDIGKLGNRLECREQGSNLGSSSSCCAVGTQGC